MKICPENKNTKGEIKMTNGRPSETISSGDESAKCSHKHTRKTAHLVLYEKVTTTAEVITIQRCD